MPEKSKLTTPQEVAIRNEGGSSLKARWKAVTGSLRRTLRGPSEVKKEPQEEEFVLPFLKIPNGYPENDTERYWLDEKEPSEQDLKAFFSKHPEALERMIVCPEINKDITFPADFYSPKEENIEAGYIMICGNKYTGFKEPRDKLFLQEVHDEKNRTTTPSGTVILKFGSYDMLPKKYQYQLITPKRTPRTFAVVNELLNTPPRPAIER